MHVALDMSAGKYPQNFISTSSRPSIVQRFQNIPNPFILGCGGNAYEMYRGYFLFHAAIKKTVLEYCIQHERLSTVKSYQQVQNTQCTVCDVEQCEEEIYEALKLLQGQKEISRGRFDHHFTEK